MEIFVNLLIGFGCGVGLFFGFFIGANYIWKNLLRWQDRWHEVKEPTDDQ